MADVPAGLLTAVKTGPIGHTILLPAEQVAAYQALVDAINQQFKPDSIREKSLAQAIVDNEWRLQRIAGIEKALVLAAQHEEFKFLARQRRFLQKRLKTDTAELNRLLRENPKPRRGLFLVPSRRKD